MDTNTTKADKNREHGFPAEVLNIVFSYSNSDNASLRD